MRYSEQSRNLAASVVLEAAVAEAVRLIRDGACDYVDQPEDVLLAAGWSAELLLGERVVSTLREAVEALVANPDDVQEWELYDCEYHDCPGCEEPHLTRVEVVWTRRLTAILAAPAPDTDALAERVTVLGQVVEVPESEHYANGWEAGVRQAFEWLQGGYEYGTGPQWREDGCEWILGCLAATSTPTQPAEPTQSDAGEVGA